MTAPSAEGRGGFLTPRRICVLVALAAIVPYLATLTYGFLDHDDTTVIQGRAFWTTPSLRTFLDLFLHSTVGVYSPLYYASFFVDRAVWGTQPLGFRVSHLVIFALGVAALLRLGRGVGLSPLAVAVAGLLFAWHPAQVESAAWLTGRAYPLAAIPSLLALIVYLSPAPRRWWERPVAADDAVPLGPRRGLAIALLLLASLTIKDTAIVLVPWLVLLAWTRGRLRRDAPWLALCVGIAGAWTALVLWLRTSMIASAAAGEPELVASARRVVHTLGHHTLQAIWPRPSPAAPAPDLSLPFGWFDVWPVLLLCGLCALGLCAWRRGNRGPALAVLLFLVALLPVSGVMPMRSFAHDRYLFFPLMPMALLAGAAVAAASRRLRASAARRRVALSVVGIALCALALQSRHYAAAWRDDLSLWRWGAAAAPRSDEARVNLMMALHRQGDQRSKYAARRMAREIVGTGANLFHAYFLLGKLHFEQGEETEARQLWERALECPATLAFQAGLRLTQLELDAGDLTAAERQLARAEAKTPSGLRAESLAMRGTFELARGRPGEAAAAFRGVTRALPTWERGWAGLAWAERAAGRSSAAERAAARLRGPASVEVQAHLALDRGELERGAQLLEAAPRTRRVALARVRLALLSGRREEARRELQAFLRRAGPSGRRLAAAERELAPLLD